eukprot:767255-Alexandrium_andersonii.AAC.1
MEYCCRRRVFAPPAATYTKFPFQRLPRHHQGSKHNYSIFGACSTGGYRHTRVRGGSRHPCARWAWNVQRA